MKINIYILLLFILIIKVDSIYCQHTPITENQIAKNFKDEGINLYKKNQFENSVLKLEKAVDHYTFLNNKEKVQFSPIRFSEERIECLYYIALNKIAQNNRDDAITILKSILNPALKHLGEKHVQVANIYYTFGQIYNEKGTYNLALEYHKKALSIQKEIFGENHFQIARSYKGIANSYFQNGFYNLGFSYFQKEFTINRKILKEESNYLTEYYNHIGLFYYYNGSYDLSLNYFLEILQIHKDTKPEEHEYLTEYYDNIGLVYTAKKSYKKALLYFEKALKIKKEKLGIKHGEVAIIYNHIGNVYAAKKAYFKALKYYQKALASNLTNFHNNIDIYQNPKLENYFYPLYLLETLQLKAEALSHLGVNENKGKNGAQISLATYELSDAFIDKIRNLRQKESDKISLGRITSKIYHGAIKTCLQLFKQSNDKNYLHKAYYFSEKSRSSVLLNNIAESSAKKFGKIPNHLLARERLLKELKNNYLKELFSQPDSAKKEFYTDKLFKVNRDYEELIASFEKDYPDYFNLKYKTKIASLTEAQKQLQGNTTLIEYFIGDSSITAFVIQKDKLKICETKATELLSNKIQKLNESLKSKDIEHFIEQASWLYNVLISPIKEELNTEKIIIIPDGPLWYLNFDMLLTQKPKHNKFTQFNYLIHDYSISYAYSVNLLLEEKSRILNTKKYECLAFSYSNPKDTLKGEKVTLRSLRNSSMEDLPGSRKEINAVSQIMEGTYYYGNQANEKNFKEQAADYSILHLALHGTVDEKQPMNSKLYFTPVKDSLNNNSEIEDNFLYAYELYNMTLNAELVVLSACNTGSGKLEKGEGVMSLGRAFTYAGCKSLVISQWKLSDYSTPIIMENFYKFLDSGRSKDEALRLAKLEYLNNTSDNQTANPYYWASLIHIGDASPLKRTHINYSWMVYTSLMLAISYILYHIVRLKFVKKHG